MSSVPITHGAPRLQRALRPLAHLVDLMRMAQLARLALVDPKTGLPNARALDERLQRAVRTARNDGSALAVLFLDLDHFKRLNDTHGHAAGDAVLAEVAQLLTENICQEDFVARFGGEEFVILVPGVSSSEAVALAERLRALIAAHRFTIPSESGAVRCTVSVGAAYFPDHATDAQGLIAQADAAMYRAKQTRNAVAVADGEVALPTPRVSGDAPTCDARADRAGRLDGRRSLGRDALLHAGGWSLVVLAAHALWRSTHALPSDAWPAAALLVALGALAELLRVEVYETDRERNSLSFAISIALAAAAALPAAAPLVALASAVVFIVTAGRRLGRRKITAHLATPVVAAWLAAHVYGAVHGGILTRLAPEAATTALGAHLTAALAAVCLYFGTHVVLISLMTGLYMGRSLTWVARHSMWFGSANVLLGVTGAFVGASHAQLGWLGVFMFAVPVLVLRSKLSFYAEHTRRQLVSLRAAKAEVDRAQEDKDDLLRRLVETVASIIDARDNSVSGHSHQVARFAVAVGQELGLDRAQLATVHTAALFHDLGKVSIPETLLHKPTRLTDDEYQRMREHAAVGERILSSVPQLRHVARMVGEHHERFDGNGYPRGRAADQISLGGRILAVVDALESMLANRPYSRGRGLDRALAELDRCAGTHFDPQVVAAVHRVIENLGPAFIAGAYDAQPLPVERILAEALGHEAQGHEAQGPEVREQPSAPAPVPAPVPALVPVAA